MTQKILLTAIVVAFTFSGCLSTNGAKPEAKEATKKVESNATKATQKLNDTTSKIESVADSATEATPPPESELKDKAIEKAVEVTDEHTDGAATKVIESVK